MTAPSIRSDRYHPARALPPPPLLRLIKRRSGGKIGDFEVWFVDGEIIRDHIDLDFVLGGNPGRYRYVPEGEIWIERGLRLTPTDAAPTILHEAVECILMQTAGATYSQGHDAANVAERALRLAITTGKVKVTSDPMPAARAALGEFLRTQK